ncbi:MAG: hypothetical protein M3308_11610, partial [Actinomycetota bacterium]|nr:hypothetical protein [Actinomycetota bacterium]
RDRSGWCVPPHPDIIVRVVHALGAQQLTERTGAWLGRQGGLGPVGAPLAGPTLLPALAVDARGDARRDRGGRADPLPARRRHPPELHRDRRAADRGQDPSAS